MPLRLLCKVHKFSALLLALVAGTFVLAKLSRRKAVLSPTGTRGLRPKEFGTTGSGVVRGFLRGSQHRCQRTDGSRPAVFKVPDDGRCLRVTGLSNNLFAGHFAFNGPAILRVACTRESLFAPVHVTKP